MSRIGKKPVNVPANVTVDIAQGNVVTVKGPKGTLTHAFHPDMILKLDAGASSYYSEIASMNTLDNLLMNGHITILQYLERIPDGYIPARRALISEIMRTTQQPQQGQVSATPGQPAGGAENLDLGAKPEIPTGGGFGALQRKVLESGTTEGMV